MNKGANLCYNFFPPYNVCRTDEILKLGLISRFSQWHFTILYLSKSTQKYKGRQDRIQPAKHVMDISMPSTARDYENIFPSFYLFVTWSHFGQE